MFDIALDLHKENTYGVVCEYAVKNKGKMPINVIQLPEEIDNDIAKLQLEAMGIEMDKLTKEEREYLESWQEGT